MQATYLQDGYSSPRGLTGWYRDLTVKEAKEGKYRQLYAIDRSGRVREVREIGKAKTWKRSPGVVLSLKYGLRECFHAGGKNRTDEQAVSILPRILVAVSHAFASDTPAGIVRDYVMDHEIS